MLNPRLFKRTGVRTGALGIVTLFFVLFGFFYINAQYLQDVKGYSPLLAGVCILPIAVVVPFASACSTGVAQRIGARATIIVGLLALGAGITALSFATAATPYAVYGLLLGVAVLSTVLTARFAGHLPASMRSLPGSRGQAITRSITAALNYASGASDPLARAHLLSATRAAFTSGTSMGLRVGVVLLALTTIVVAVQRPQD